ncbi:hypothetical protein G6F22_015306 [Rhizopus arrhizus]|nr:hypothetical protein G6F22_015306 [Rhizopus arrhizus]
MRASASVKVVFDQARGAAVGAPGAYVDRPGFLHGGAGVAACWYGALAGIAERLRAAVAKGRADPYRLAHLGAVDVALAEARAVLREAAAAIDAHPEDGCVLHTARARLAVEAAAEDVLNRVPRALGAGPLCRDAALAQALADLPVRRAALDALDAHHFERLYRKDDDPWRVATAWYERRKRAVLLATLARERYGHIFEAALRRGSGAQRGAPRPGPAACRPGGGHGAHAGVEVAAAMAARTLGGLRSDRCLGAGVLPGRRRLRAVPGAPAQQFGSGRRIGRLPLASRVR